MMVVIYSVKKAKWDHRLKNSYISWLDQCWSNCYSISSDNVWKIPGNLYFSYDLVEDYDFKYSLGYSSVINDEALMNNIEAVITKTFGTKFFTYIDPVIPGEDFSAFEENCPGAFLGIFSEDRSGISEIMIYLDVESDASPEQLKDWKEQVVKRCPVIDNLLYGTKIAIGLDTAYFIECYKIDRAQWIHRE